MGAGLLQCARMAGPRRSRVGRIEKSHSMRTIRYIVKWGGLMDRVEVRNARESVSATILLRGRMQKCTRPLSISLIVANIICLLFFVSALSAQAQEAIIRIDRIIGDDDTEIYFDRINTILPDGHGNIYVADGRRRDIQHITASGKLIRSIGSRGEGPGQFREISTVILKGDLLVVHDAHSMRVTVFSRDGRLLHTFSLSDEGITIESLISVLPDSLFMMYRAPNSIIEMERAFRVVDRSGHIQQTVSIHAPDLYDVDDDIGEYLVTSQSNLRVHAISDHKYLLTSRAYNGQILQLYVNLVDKTSYTEIVNHADVSMSHVYDRVHLKRGDSLPPLTNVMSRQNRRFAYKLKRMNLGFINVSNDRRAVLYREGIHPSERQLFIDTWDEDEREVERYPVSVVGDELSPYSCVKAVGD